MELYYYICDEYKLLQVLKPATCRGCQYWHGLEGIYTFFVLSKGAILSNEKGFSKLYLLLSA